MAQNYIGSTGPSPARIMVVGEAPLAQDNYECKPFTGFHGRELTATMHEAGIIRAECFLTNALRFHPRGDDPSFFVTPIKGLGQKLGYSPFNGRWCAPFVPSHLDQLKREISLVNPNVIVAAGEVALWALTGQSSILDWRSSEMSSVGISRPDGKPYKVIPIIHPAKIAKMYPWRYLIVNDLRRVAREANSPEVYSAPYNFLIRPTFRTVIDFLDTLKRRLDAGPRKVSVDIETRSGKIACLGLGLSKFDAICIPFMCISKPAGYWQTEEELAVVLALRTVLRHPNARVIGQNFLYDQQYKARWFGFVPDQLFDTMTAHHTCFAGLEKSLDFLSSIYCEHHLFWKNEGKEWNAKIPEEVYWGYNCKDCCVTFEVSDVLDDVIVKLGQQEQNCFQQRLNKPVLQMMLRGVRVDEKAKTDFAHEAGMAMQERMDYVQQLLGHPLNPRSPKQMQALFYNDFKQQIVFDKKTKRPTTADEALDQIAKREPLLAPLCRAINEYRSLGVFKSTFLEAEMEN